VEELAALMAVEMGKPVAQGRAEVEKRAWACEHYAAEAPGILAPTPIATTATRSMIVYRPLGVVLAIMPWNFPFWQVWRCLAPNLMAGNTVVLKHASNVTGSALAIADVVAAAGFPDGAVGVLRLASSQVAAMIADPRIAAVTLTGSTAAGRAVASVAGAHVKKTVLELGGSDPYVVLADADLERAAATCVAARLVNSGQSCIAAKRFVVAAPVYDAFLERFVAGMRAQRMGDPLSEVDVGPLARWDLRDTLHDQVGRSVRAGARLLTGGAVPQGPGAYYPPTVLADVEPGMAVFDEETFGPVAAVSRAADEDAAVALANRSPFGLGAAVFTADVERGETIARERLAAGSCFVNAFVRSDPRLPFGGIKASGYGRELGAIGLHEFVNAKTVWVE
jgi:succinate-semialdehyde dehydrogenase/glutarate-semialdehyde dehydrogenase